MSENGWSHLNSRFGNLDGNTSAENIRCAVREMYHEDHPDLSDGDYAEHPDAWIDRGLENGPLYTLTIQRFGRLQLEKRADQDDVDAAESFQMDNVAEEQCCRICESFVAGDMESLLREPWE
jgi:hypothetical protein